MFGYDEIGISLSFHFVFLLFALVLIVGYTYFTYKYLIPKIGILQKIVLITLRTVALLLLVIVLFEPILNLVKKENITPLNLVFVDNSRSMTIEDQTKRKENTIKIAEDLASYSETKNLKLYTFGNEIEVIQEDSINDISFTDGITNIANIFSSVQKDEVNLASIILISDGVFNAGNNPYYRAVSTGVPVFSIGIGDTTQKKDVVIKKVLYNEIIYVETPTTIITTIQNNGFVGNEVTASLIEEGNLITSEKIKLNNSGIQNINFDYTPETSGEKKLAVTISSTDGEFTLANNKKIIYLNVLSNKIKVLLLASSPSSDLSFIKSTLVKDENLSVNTITQISIDRFLGEDNYIAVDSAEIFYLVGFPSNDTPEDLWDRVQDKIATGKVPYLLLLSNSISLNKLLNLKSELSFTLNQTLSGYRQVQPEISQDLIAHPLIQHSSSNIAAAWSNLPPVLQPNNIFTPKPESRILSSIKVNNKLINSPLILLRNFSGRKSITILAKDIWRWKLQTATKRIDLFDSFILNSVRWLNANVEKKRVNIKTSKKNYSQGERIDFSAQVFDESLNPVSGAGVKVKITSDKNSYETDLQVVSTGIYESTITINETGDFTFSGEAALNGNLLGDDNGIFNIGEIDLEMIDPVMNYNLLNLISEESGGEFYSPNNFTDVLQRIDEINRLSTKEKINTSEFKLWSNEWLLVIAIFLFSFEWFLRKRIGLL
jgi:hypothetical protein